MAHLPPPLLNKGSSLQNPPRSLLFSLANIYDETVLPKELNGVVDNTLKVYGVDNLRVVDSSAIPVISTANIQATVYAFAERAVDLIKECHGLK